MTDLIDSPIDLDSCRVLLADRDRQIATLEGDVVSLRQRLNDALEACGTPQFQFAKPVAESERTEPYITPVATITESNGVTAPKSGVTKKVWDIADKITEDRKVSGFPPATKADVVSVATSEGIKETTAQAAYSSWCKFHQINAKDTSKPYVAKEPKVKEIKVVEAAPTPQGELVEVVVLPATESPLDHLIGSEVVVHIDSPQGNTKTVATFMPPPPLPVFLPPPPLPL